MQIWLFLKKKLFILILPLFVGLPLGCTSKPAFHPTQAETRKVTKKESVAMTGRNAGRLAATLAVEQIGALYRYGGRSPAGFDCSGLVQYVYGKLGVNLPRKSREMAGVGHQVPIHALLPGDLVFFRINRNRVSHVGIYIGNDKFVHATKSGHPVRKDVITNPWWRERFVVGRRLF